MLLIYHHFRQFCWTLVCSFTEDGQCCSQWHVFLDRFVLQTMSAMLSYCVAVALNAGAPMMTNSALIIKCSSHDTAKQRLSAIWKAFALFAVCTTRSNCRFGHLQESMQLFPADWLQFSHAFEPSNKQDFASTVQHSLQQWTYCFSHCT